MPGSLAYGGSCDSTNAIISNDMVSLAGNGDTLWVASQDTRLGLGLNDTIAGAQRWGGQYLSCFANYNLQCTAYGSRTVAALLYPVSLYGTGFDSTKPNLLWHYTLGASGPAALDTLSIQFFTSSGINKSFEIDNGVYSGGKFYFCCRGGGIVAWNPSVAGPAGLSGILPGDPIVFPLDSAINASLHPKFATPAGTLLSIDRFGDSAVVVAGDSSVRIYNYVQNSWDSTTVSRNLSKTMTFDSLFVVFTNSFSPTPQPLLYGLIYYTSNNAPDSGLFRYHYGTKTWSLILSAPQTVIAPASRGCLYTVDKGSNKIQVYRDSLPDADTVTLNQPLVSGVIFLNRLNITENPQPQQYNNILFVPTHDSTGHLFIATGSGLYYSWNEIPGITTDTLSFVERAKTIGGGLTETYALPGILNNSYNGSDVLQKSSVTFVYKLARDANVTIKVYDYNMQLTKLVINNQPRKAAGTSGRSTNAAQDIWNGTTDSGRLAAPGVYYYKITASTGERSFGKIVIAKAMQDPK